MRRSAVLLVVVCLSLVMATASGFWTTLSVSGGHGAAAASSINQGSTPTATASGRSVTVTWAASTLTNGLAVTGYEIKRYAQGTSVLQTIQSACTGTITSTSCVESRMPTGQWVYSVTPLFGATWRGPESVKSSPVTVLPPTLSLTATTVKPGTSVSGTAAGFLTDETVRFRLDSPTGTELTGTYAGAATPAPTTGSGSGAVSIVVPGGASDGIHTLYAVASPSTDAGTASIVVDGTPPPVPVITGKPTATSGDSVTFTFTEAETSATVECRLDAEAFSACTSPVDYSALSGGSHTFSARAVDTVGNTSASTSYTWSVDVTLPTISIAFPSAAGQYNDAGFNAGCATSSTGDVCGVADDDNSVVAVSVSLRQHSTGRYWNGSSFPALSLLEVFYTASGTTDWSYGLTASALSEGDYTLRARAKDWVLLGSEYGYDSRTFTIDRTPPPVPTLTSVPPAVSGPSATVAFTSSESSATLQCQLDTGAWTACTSPSTYSGLSHGAHDVKIRAVDAAGNVSAVAATSWTVDAIAPTAAVVFPGTTTYNSPGWTAGCATPTVGDLCGTAADSGSGLASVDVSVLRVATNTYWNGSGFAAAGETWLSAAGTASWSYAFAADAFPSDGAYVVRWRATDVVGNAATGSVSLTIDATPPPMPVLVTAPPNPSGGDVQLDFTVAESGAGTECKLDAGAWVACAAPTGYTGLAEGSHTFSVRSVDGAGNLSAAVSHTWTVDVGIPSISVTFPSATRSYNDTTYAAGCGSPTIGDVCGTAADPQGSIARVDVSLQRASTSLFWNGTAFASSTEVFFQATGSSTWSYPMPATSYPAEGAYLVSARATDAVGLTATDTVVLTIDRTPPPAPTIGSGPTGATTGGDAFAFSGETGATFECRVDAGGWATCASPKTYPSLTDGPHTFDVRALDGAGNTGASVSRSWSIDTVAPMVGTTFPVADAAHNNATWATGCSGTSDDVCGTATDAGGTVTLVEVALRRTSTGLYWSGSGFTSAVAVWTAASGTSTWSSPFAAAGFPADGAYDVQARATDSVGNTSTPTTRSFAIDRTGPSAAAVGAVDNGATPRRIETGDQLVLTFSESIAPGSLIAGWDGTGTQNITIRQANNTNDLLTFYNSANTTRLPLGSVQLKRSDYVSAAVIWGATGTRSTLSRAGGVLTLTFGTPDKPANVTTAAAAANMVWLPRAGVTAGAGITDLVGNLGTSTNRAETDLDNDF